VVKSFKLDIVVFTLIDNFQYQHISLSWFVLKILLIEIKDLWFMVFYATFNNISVNILRRSVLLVEETEVPGENH
jgi:hypothetical protein